MLKLFFANNTQLYYHLYYDIIKPRMKDKMKIGILADTHIRDGSLPLLVWNALEDVQMILHAGDILIESVLEELSLLAPVVAVKGNCDWFFYL